MRRTSALAFAVVALALASPASAVASPSPSASVDRQAWARTGPAAPPDARAGSIYVAVAGGQEQARAFLHIDTGGLGAAQIAGSRVLLTPGTDGLVADQASLVACSLSSPLTASGELTAPPPGADCSRRTDLARTAEGTWTLPLAVFADIWADGHNPGLAIIPNPDAAPTPFTVSFDTAKTALDAPAAAAPDTTTQVSSPAATYVAPATELGGPAELILPAEAPLTAEPAPVRAAASRAAPRILEGALSRATHPSPLVILVPVLLAAGVLWARSRRRAAHTPGGIAVPAVAGVTAWKAVAWVAAPLVVMTFGETTIYKLGLVAIAFVAAIGLHLLVNWTGELSLAHAAFIGVPAFAVAQFSSNSGLSPLLGLPLAVVVGVALGSIVGVAALRSRGLQVALVTLAFAIAAGQFLFFRTWVVGPAGGLQMPAPSLFGVELSTARALVPVLALAVLFAVVCAKSIMRSKIGRALLMVRSDPDAAAAAGVAVARHRALAYAFAGAFAGLAGWAYVVWVQQVSAKAFPLQLGFTYLVIAALAGPGGLGGVIVAATIIQGGALFSILPHTVALYLAPVALIVNVTRYQEGFNGVLRVTRTAIESRMGAIMQKNERPELRLQVMLGTLAIVAGFSAIALAWYHMGNTGAVWVQNQELMSGGVAGLGLIVVGATLLLRDALLAGRADTAPPPAERAVPELAPPPEIVALPEVAALPTANGVRRRPARANAR